MITQLSVIWRECFMSFGKFNLSYSFEKEGTQGATIVLSDSPGLVEWLVGLAFSYRSLPDGQAPLILLFWW